MRVFVTGGTGLVGRRLIARLLARDHQVLCVTRNPGRAVSVLTNAVECIGADPTLPGVWQDRMLTCDAVVNLAGEPIAVGRWSKQGKRRIRRSRLAVTGLVAAGLARSERPVVLMSASAVGYYGDCGGEALTEEHEPGQDFLARVAVEWEHAALKAARENVRVAVLRLGVVLAADEGALGRILPLFKRGLGGPLGSGKQYFPWVHVEDVVSAILFVLATPAISGAVNVTAADPPSQAQFARALGRVLGKATPVRVPRFLLQLLLGPQSAVVTGSQRAVPNVLKAHGFKFAWGDLDQALVDICAQQTS